MIPQMQPDESRVIDISQLPEFEQLRDCTDEQAKTVEEMAGELDLKESTIRSLLRKLQKAKMLELCGKKRCERIDGVRCLKQAYKIASKGAGDNV